MSELEDYIDQLTGPPVKVDDEAIQSCRERDQFGSLSFDLYKETVTLISIICSTYDNTGDGLAMARKQAVRAGLLSRVSKLMVSVLKLSSETEHGDTVQIINRCIIESSIDLQYLLTKDDETIYEKFVKTGLRSERELYDLIQSNIQKRGGQKLEIEEDMLQSITRTCDKSGVRIEDIDSKAGSWGGSYRDRMRAIGMEENYPIFQGTASQAIHGSWSDLIRNHLDKNDSGYKTKLERPWTDGKLLGPTALIAIETAKAYIDSSFDPVDTQPFSKRLNDLQRRLSLVEASRPGWDLVP